MTANLTTGGGESRFTQGMGVRLGQTVEALKRDLAGTQTELLRLRVENTELRQRLKDATEKIDKVRLKGLRARQSEILAMVRQRQKTSEKTSQLIRHH
jgi:regulator of replication initiation timing